MKLLGRDLISVITKAQISFYTLNNKVKYIPEETEVEVMRIRPGHTYIKENGERGITKQDSFVLVYGNELIDIDKSEFKTLD